MSSSKLLAQELAKTIVAYLRTEHARKAEYADALNEQTRYGSYDDPFGRRCRKCSMPMIDSRRVPSCTNCGHQLACFGPYCDPKDDIRTMTCGICQMSDFCKRCLNLDGCVLCGTLVCRRCIEVDGTIFKDVILCSKECVQKSSRKKSRTE